MSWWQTYQEMGNSRLERFRKNASLALLAEYAGRPGAITWRSDRATQMCQLRGWWLH